ncbi:MAG: hypothetical protein J7518_07845 [Nocardioidaceae bacterium]|nr:hypothetical protein [Nocardioidaceae bacterium]
MTNSAVHITAWRRWATQHRLAAAVVAGIVATHIGTVFAFFLGGLGLARVDWSTANGAVYMPLAGDAHFSDTTRFLFGTGMHYVDGILFAIIFAVAFHPLLPFRSTPHGNMVKGVVFGLILTFVSLVILAPYVYGPAFGMKSGIGPGSVGFLAHHAPGGWEWTIGAVLFHIVYGLHLGLIYNPTDEEDHSITRDRQAVLAGA